jgi:hypothetical protein
VAVTTLLLFWLRAEVKVIICVPVCVIIVAVQLPFMLFAAFEFVDAVLPIPIPPHATRSKANVKNRVTLSAFIESLAFPARRMDVRSQALEVDVATAGK